MGGFVRDSLLGADDARAASRAEHFERARAHADFDAVTELGGSVGWPDPFTPFGVWRALDPQHFPVEFDPVAPNRTVRLESHGDGLAYFDVQVARESDRVASPMQAVADMRLPANERSEVALLFEAFGSISGRFPPDSSARLFQTTVERRVDGQGISTRTVQSNTVDDAGRFEAGKLEPGSYEIVAAWSVDERSRVLSRHTVDLAPGEHRDLGLLAADRTRSLVVRPEFVAFGREGTLAPIDLEQLKGARVKLDVASRGPSVLPGIDSLLNWDTLAIDGRPLRIDGLPDGRWSVRAEHDDGADTGWALVDSRNDGVEVAMPGRVDVPLTVLLHRGEEIAVTLDLAGNTLAPGTRLAATTWAAGRQVGSESSFRWVAGEDGGGWPVARVSALAGRNRVFASVWIPEESTDALADEGAGWVGFEEVDVEFAGSAQVTLAVRRAASVRVHFDQMPAELVDAKGWSVAPLDGGPQRTGRVWSEVLVFEELLPTTVYRFAGSEHTFTTGGPGTTLDIGW